MEFVNFSIAKKLKEKGFTCNYPFAMYNEFGYFHPLYTSCEETLFNCMFGNRGYYDYDDFDETDCIAPTISQVLKWLREEKKLHICIDCWDKTWGYDVIDLTSFHCLHFAAYREDIKSYEDAALCGIKYALDNLI